MRRLDSETLSRTSRCSPFQSHSNQPLYFQSEITRPILQWLRLLGDREGLYTGRFFGGAERDKGGASAPTTHPHRSRPYAAMLLPANLTKKPPRVSREGRPYIYRSTLPAQFYYGYAVTALLRWWRCEGFHQWVVC
jgi:hypothetical protein